jgi:hypothetical protein
MKCHCVLTGNILQPFQHIHSIYFSKPASLPVGTQTVTHAATKYFRIYDSKYHKESCPCPHSKGMKRNGGTVPLIFDLDTKSTWAVSFMIWPLYHLGQSSWYPLNRRTDEYPGLNWMLSCPCQEKNQDSSVSSSDLAIPAAFSCRAAYCQVPKQHNSSTSDS